MDLTDRLTGHDTWLTKRILDKATTLSDPQLDAPLPVAENPVAFEEPEKTLRELLNRIVFTNGTPASSTSAVTHLRPSPTAA